MSYAPYPAYKDSGAPWLGQVPEGWNVKPLKRYLGIQNGRDYKAIEVDDGYPVYGSGGQFTKASDYLYDGDAVLLGRKGTIDKPLHVSGRFWTVDTMYYAIPHPNVSARFMYYCATCIPFSLYATDTALPSMTQTKLDNHPIAAPEFEEQIAIADFLDKKTAEIDDLIAKKEELLRLLAEQRTALITHAVTKGLDPHAPMKPSGVVWFDQVPTHWQVRRLKDVGKLIGGAGFPHEFQNVQGEELFFYKVGDLAKSDDGIHLTSAPHTINRETAAKLRASVIPPDVILYAKIGAALLLNRRRITTADCCIDNNMTAWIVDPTKVLPLWGFYWMSTVDFGEHTNPGAVPSLSEGYQSVLPITIPPLDEQQRIVDRLVSDTKAIDSVSKKTSEAVDRLKEYRTALITNAVTGKIKVA